MSLHYLHCRNADCGIAQSMHINLSAAPRKAPARLNREREQPRLQAMLQRLRRLHRRVQAAEDSLAAAAYAGRDGGQHVRYVLAGHAAEML
jgi:hypothetical protein